MPQDNPPCPRLTVLPNGCVSKNDLRKIFFFNSRFHYLNTIRLLCQNNSEFENEYQAYKYSKNLPKKITTQILTHNAFEVGTDYVFVNIKY